VAVEAGPECLFNRWGNVQLAWFGGFGFTDEVLVLAESRIE
jgi:hypothetical protein